MGISQIQIHLNYSKQTRLFKNMFHDCFTGLFSSTKGPFKKIKFGMVFFERTNDFYFDSNYRTHVTFIINKSI